MITPAFNLTATERVLPKLALDFTTASLDARVTFTRTTGASNPATYVDSNGYVASATNNQPRFDYNPLTLACKGLLIEESRANAFTYSDDFRNTAAAGSTRPWTYTNVTVSADAGTSPTNTQIADKIEETSATGEHFVAQNATYANATTYTWSIFVKKVDRDYFWIRLGGVPFGSGKYAFFNVANGTVGTVISGLTASIVDFGNGWYRCVVTATSIAAAVAGTAFGVSTADNTLSYAGSTGSGNLYFGAQLEVGAFATSYIPTTTTALTRNADVATMTGTNFSNWYTAGTGAFNCAVIPKSATGTKPVLQFDDTTALNTITMQGNATAVELKITTLSVLQSTLSTGTITANTAYGSCGAWTAGSNALSKSGGAATTGSPVSIPTVTQSRLGSDGTNYFNGWLQKINYWPQRLTNSEVQAFSK